MNRKAVTLPVHPAAAVFPMHSEPQLQELAAHIKAHGLIDPIMKGMWRDEDENEIEGILDGRNRLKACEMAGVAPRYDKLNGGIDAVAYIVGKNLLRRDMTAGQKAMAYAFIYPEPERGKRTDLRKVSASSPVPDSSQLAKARAILVWSRTKATDILNGASPFDRVFSEMNAEAQKSKGNEANIARLRDNAPDLADLVDQHRLDLDGALSQMNARMQEARRVIDMGRQAVEWLAGELVGKVLAIKGAQEQQEQLPPFLAKDANLIRPVAFSDVQVVRLHEALDVLQSLLGD